MPNSDSTADLEWASDVLAAACVKAPSTLQLDIRLHVSRAAGPVSTLVQSVDGSLHTSVKGSRADMSATVEELSTQGHTMTDKEEHLRVHTGRPDVAVIIQEEIVASTGPVSIIGELTVNRIVQNLTRLLKLACGPFNLTEAVRASLRSGAAGPSAMLHGGVSVSMHIENFGQ
jgi:ferric-chelate reductase